MPQTSLQEVLVGNHVAGVLRQHLQQPVLLGRQLQLLAVEIDVAPRKIDGQRPRTHDGLAAAPRDWRRKAARARASNSAMPNGFTT